MNRVTWVVAYTLVSRLILVAAVLVPVWYVRDPTVAIQGTVAAAAVAFVPGMVLMIRAAPGRVGGSLGAGIREQLKYAVPLGLGAMIGTFNKNIGSVMVAGSSSKEEFAVFVNGALEIPMIVLITGSAASVMLPDLTRFFSEGKFEEAVQLFQRSAVKCGMILIPLTGLLFVVAPALMRALYGEGFTGSAIFFRLYLLILPLRVVMFASLFQAAGRSDLVLKRTIYGLVVMVTLCWGFLHWLGPVGAALATVTTIALYTTPYCVWTCSRLYKTTFFKLLPVRDLFVLVGPMVVLTSVLVLGGEAFSTGNWIADAAISALLYGVLILGLYHLLGIRVLEAFGVTRNLMARK
jgi:O-antigen/teichoic acid export membrane protein